MQTVQLLACKHTPHLEWPSSAHSACGMPCQPTVHMSFSIPTSVHRGMLLDPQIIHRARSPSRVLDHHLYIGASRCKLDARYTTCVHIACLTSCLTHAQVSRYIESCEERIARVCLGCCKRHTLLCHIRLHSSPFSFTDPSGIPSCCHMTGCCCRFNLPGGVMDRCQ